MLELLTSRRIIGFEAEASALDDRLSTPSEGRREWLRRKVESYLVAVADRR